MPVPLLDLKRQNLALEVELKAAFERVLFSGHYILGPEMAAFEREFAQFLGVKHALGISSGTDALLLALMALDIGPGDEVLVPAFTFFATAGCVARLGATPVFVDVCTACFNLDAADAAKKITPRTKAIVPVHLFGQAADMDAILALAAKNKLAVVEDAAQSLGARFQDKYVGAIGTCGAFSFFPTKNLGALGDAGLFTTNDDALAERATILRVHGMKPKYHHPFLGGNFRLDALQAALLRVKLPHYAGYTQGRQANAAWYTERLSRLPGVVVTQPQDCHRHPAHAAAAATSSTSPAPKITLPAACPRNGHIWNQYTLRVHGPGRRDALMAYLQARSIGAEIYYPLSLDQQPCFQKTARGGENCTRARALAGEVISIPIFPEITPAEREEVAAAIEAFLKQD
jgi:dTDP-4-amino-4,6-dideoxygalactose transaminase